MSFQPDLAKKPLLAENSDDHQAVTYDTIPHTQTDQCLEDVDPPPTRSWQRWLAIAGIVLSNMITAYDSTVMASTHVVISSTFNSANLSSWYTTSFLLGATSCQPLFAPLSECVGRKSIYILSILIFATGTALCASAPSSAAFIASRTITGIGSGGLYTMSSVVLCDMVPLHRRASYQSLNYIFYGTGTMLGASCGGWLAEIVGWRWEFWLQLPVVICSAFLLLVAVPSIPERDDDEACPTSLRKRLAAFDKQGAILLSLTILCVVSFVTLGGNELPWLHPYILTLFLFALVFGTLCWHIEKKALNPIFPLFMVQSFPERNILVGGFCITFINSNILFNIPLYFQSVMLEPAGQAGMRLLIPGLCNTFASSLAGILITRFASPRPTLLLGSALILLGSIGLAVMTIVSCVVQIPQNVWQPSWTYNFYLILPSIGVGMCGSSLVMYALGTSEEKNQAAVNSCWVLMRSIGNMMGVACGSGLVQNLALIRMAGYSINAAVIHRVRKSLTIIPSLSAAIKLKVVLSYNVAIIAAFSLGVLIASIFVMTIAQLPPLDLKTVRDRKNKK